MRRLDDLGLRLGESIWSVIGGEESRPSLLTMANVKKFTFELMENYPAVKGCALNIERKGDHYEVIQLMIDQNEEAIKSGRGYLGRTMQVQDLDKSVIDFMDGEKLKKLIV